MRARRRPRCVYRVAVYAYGTYTAPGARRGPRSAWATQCVVKMSRAGEPSSAGLHVRGLRAIAVHLGAGTRGHSNTTAGAAVACNTASHQGLVDMDFFDVHGWVVVPSVVPREAVQKVADEIATLLRMDLSNPSDWYNDSGGAYGEKPLEIGAGMVELYQSQGLWDNRTAPKVHQAFAEVLGSEKLLVTMDRCNFKPPARSADDPWNTGLPLHWDGPRPGEADPFLEELSVQGALLLSDVGSGGGGQWPSCILHYLSATLRRSLPRVTWGDVLQASCASTDSIKNGRSGASALRRVVLSRAHHSPISRLPLGGNQLRLLAKQATC